MIKKEDWQHLEIAIVGLGSSGKAAVEALERLGAKLRLYDENPQSLADMLKRYPQIEKTVPLSAQAIAQDILETNPNIVVVSPGIPGHHPLYQVGIPPEKIWSEVELAWQLQNSIGNPECKWLCVTGTNGKTTTVGLVASILAANGEKAAAVGNIGQPVVLAAASGEYETLAVELSSFQLYTTHSVAPEASICLNLGEDHLDWHGTFAEYQAAKAKVYENTKTAAVYNAAHSQTLEQVLNADVQEGCRAVGIITGVPDIWQVGVVEDLIVDRAFVPNPRKNAEAIANFADIQSFTGSSLPLTTIEDVLAAVALTRAHGVEAEAIATGIRSYKPAPHRRAIVGRAMDVTWIDDSKATNAHAAAASLRGCAAQSVVWIAGGDGKGQVFSDLVREVAPVLRGVVLIGKERKAFRTALEQNAPQVPVTELEDHPEIMVSAVHEAVALSRPGDEVILAPACASWDQFKNYQERGEIFTNAILELEAQ